MRAPTVVKIYLTPAPFLYHPKIPLYLLTATSLLLPPGSLSPSAPSLNARAGSLSSLPSAGGGRRAARRGRGPRAGGDERAPGQAGELPQCGPAWVWAGELPPGRARVRPGEPPPPGAAKRRGSKGQGGRRHVLCDFFSIFDYAGDGDESLCNVNQIDLCVVNWILCFLV